MRTKKVILALVALVACMCIVCTSCSGGGGGGSSSGSSGGSGSIPSEKDSKIIGDWNYADNDNYDHGFYADGSRKVGITTISNSDGSPAWGTKDGKVYHGIGAICIVPYKVSDDGNTLYLYYTQADAKWSQDYIDTVKGMGGDSYDIDAGPHGPLSKHLATFKARDDLTLTKGTK